MSSELKAAICTILAVGVVVAALIIPQVGVLILISTISIMFYYVFKSVVYEEIFLPYFQKLHSKEDETQ